MGPFVDGYRVSLLELGYSPLTAVHSLTALGHLGRWMAREGVDVDQLDAGVVSAFLAAHVKDRGRLPTASVEPLLHYLRREGVLGPAVAGPLTPLDRLIGEYREWLLIERALAATTVCSCEALARRFLAKRISPHDELGVENLTGVDVTGFLIGESARVRLGSAACYANRLRSLLRFLSVRGLADPGLVECVPSVGRWRDAHLPQFPARPAIDRLLDSCDRSSVVGARDFAILMLLARLGLRAVEVSRLELVDLRWRAGEIEVDGKGHERGRLPLPSDVGDALVGYLTLRRHSGSRRVFLTVRAPTRPIEPSGVRSVVRDACRRAGVERIGAHRLRHALASALLREGASLLEISQVLRHKDLETTAIYAKVDLTRLRQAAQPWPGTAR
ncbi:MAG: tyrosine-type recombinase/integrase [Solirubrobacteraceae bacterium]